MEEAKVPPSSDKKRSSKLDHFYSLIESLSKPNQNAMSPQQDVVLKFMEKTITKVNYCLASLYATQQLLVQKGIVTRAELIDSLREAKGLPAMAIGRDMLESILDDNEVDSILTMIDLPEDTTSDDAKK